MNNKKSLIKLIAVVSGLLVLLGAVALVKKTQELRRKAYYGGITASVLPSEKKVNVGDSFQMRLKLVPNQGDATYYVNGVDLKLGFDPNIVKVSSVELDDVFQGMPDVSSANQSGQLRLLGVTTLQREMLHSDVFDYAVVTFKALKKGQTEIKQVGDYEIVGSRGQTGDMDRELRLDDFSSGIVEVGSGVPAEEEAAFSLVPAVSAVSSGNEFGLDIQLETDEEVVIGTAVLNFEPQKLKVVDLVSSDLFSNKMQVDYDNQAGRVVVKQGLGGDQSSVTGRIDFASIRFKAVGNSGQTSAVNFIEDESSVASQGEVYLNLGTHSAKVEITSGQVEPEANFSLVPSEVNVGSEENFELDLRLNTNKSVVIATAQLTFDPIKLEATDVIGSDGFPNKMQVDYNNQSGEVTIKQGVGGGKDPMSGKMKFGTVKFKAIGSPGEIATVSYDEVSSSVAEEDEAYLSFETSGSKINITELTQPTPTPPQQGWPSLTFKISFAGTSYRVNDIPKVIEDIGTQEMKVVVRGNGVTKVYDDVPVKFDDQAVGTATVELTGVPAGENYMVLVKGPKHLARRFCEEGQKEHCWLGEESIDLNPGENVFDWTGLELEPGDINQDGVVNTLDFSKLKQALGTRGKDISEDLNFNGIVNPQDVVFFLETLSTKYEDEI